MSAIGVAGFRFAGIHCGIKKSGKPDLALLVADGPVACAGVYTTNQIVAAPVVQSKARLAGRHTAKVVVINSGNANACTGPQGDSDARQMAALAATAAGCQPLDVQVCSTGVIGAPLPMAVLERGIPLAYEHLTESGLADFGEAICTTDTFAKLRQGNAEIDGRMIHVAGVSKGAGMIHPNMATMLGVLVTDAPISPAELDPMWRRVCHQTFNAITIDGDTSTNDTALVLASGRAGGATLSGEALARFETLLHDVASELAKDIVRDAEGGSKLVEITISGAATLSDAAQAADAVSLSPLVKTAMHGEDPNWGRIIAAAGRSGALLDPDKLTLWMNDVVLYRDGAWQGVDAEAAAHEVMCLAEYAVRLDLGIGTASRTVFTCDFSADYVRINADYRS